MTRTPIDFPLKSVLSAGQFDTNLLMDIYATSFAIEQELKNKRRLAILNDYILASLFFESSTRTRLSFEAAMLRLSGKVISAVGVQFSSMAKGESLFDTLKMVESYADICVIRHPVEGASELAARNIDIPVINGGDGAGEHPTQALLDFYTIHKHKNVANQKVKIAFIGDIKYGRTIHSLAILLSQFNVELVFISPTALKLPEKYSAILREKNVQYSETTEIEACRDVDVLYVTRIQEERFIDRHLYDQVKYAYEIDKEFILQCRKDCIVMHPLPRLTEINIDVDDMANAVYFEQAKNGLYVRMALLMKLLGKSL